MTTLSTEDRIKQLEDKVAYLSGQIDTILELSKSKAVDTPQPPFEVDDSSNIDMNHMEPLRNFELPSARRYRLEAQLAVEKSKQTIHTKKELDGELAS
jgi:hypothetical protein